MNEELEKTDIVEVESGCECVRTEPWTLDDFVPVFTQLGLVPDGDEYVSVQLVQTGRMVVNGKESVQQAEHRLSFRFDKEFVGEMDGSPLAGVWVCACVGGQVLFSELVYCTPNDIPKYYALYTNGK